MTDFSKLANLQRNIAADVWPNGAILACARCRFSQRITTEQAGDYLKRGWPTHCGRTMTCEAAAPREVPDAG